MSDVKGEEIVEKFKTNQTDLSLGKVIKKR